MLSVIPVGEWLPDLPPFGNKGATIAKNVIPEAAAYHPLPALNEYFGALTTRCQGHFAAKEAGGTVVNYAGDSERLYKLTELSWSNVSTSSFSYATAFDDFWEFVQWNNRVICTNGTDPLQHISLDGTAFASLSGAPPIARHIAVVKNFVVLGNISGSPDQVRWCAIDNPDSWTITVATQADFQVLYGNGGEVFKVVGGEYGTIFQEKQIQRMQYVGHPAIFSFEVIDRQRGAFNSASVVPVGDISFYLSETGFFYFDGARSIPISDKKVEKWFFRDVDYSNLHRVFGAADVERKIVMWIYPSSNNSSGTPNRAVIYNWTLGKWSYGEFTADILCQFLSPGYTLDELDSVSSSVDALPASLDSRIWNGGLFSFGAFSADKKFATFSGTPLDAVVETGEVQHIPGKRAHIRKGRPIVDGDSATVAVGTRDLLSGTYSFSAPVTQNASGDCPQRSNSRYHRYRISTSGDFSFIQGIEVEYEPGEER